ncbi:MAG TPA: hypothetical protein VGN12_26545 [Pirellulales bacterium]|jgi:hypothetical protein
MIRKRLFVVAAMAVVTGLSCQAFAQTAAMPQWDSLSTFDASRIGTYSMTGQASDPADPDSTIPAVPPNSSQPAANPFAPRPASEVFNPPVSAPTCPSCNSLPCAVPGSCAPAWSPIALAESTFFWPTLAHGNSFVGTGSSGLNGPLDQTLAQSNNLFLAGPRIMFGRQGQTWGVLGRFWYASNWGSGFGPTDAGSETGGFSAYNAFQAYTADLEMQRRWSRGLWNFWGFGGIRYGSVAIGHRETANQFADGYAISSTAYSAQSFQGTGITFGGYSTRALGNSPFKLFFSNRYSILWGTSHADAQVATSLVCTTMPSAWDANGMSASRTGDLFIAEFQAGTQWERQLVWFPGRAFLRTAFEYQYWGAGGGLCASAESTSHISPVVSTACSYAEQVMFNLVGFNIGAGIIY